MVVTDLHGDFDLYRRYRDRFLKLRAWGFARRLILCGDLIHSEGPARADRSLDIMLDVLALQQTLGPDLIILLGNHEMPHIYGVNLARGDVEYTPRFEAAMGAHRAAIVALLKRLPFYVRTQAGVMISHAGAPPAALTPTGWDRLRGYDHDAVLAQADVLAHAEPEALAALRADYAKLAGQPYDTLARRYLAVSGPDDPRYDDLLRALIVSDSEAFNFLWSALFTRNELDIGEAQYGAQVDAFLRVASEGFTPQRVLVAGHIPTRGRRIVAEKQLRLYSGAQDGVTRDSCYLLLDTAQAVDDAYDLLPHVFRIDDA